MNSPIIKITTVGRINFHEVCAHGRSYKIHLIYQSINSEEVEGLSSCETNLLIFGDYETLFNIYKKMKW